VSKKTKNQATAQRPVRASALDAFVNYMTRQGLNMPNAQNTTAYPITRLTQNYLLLMSMYRNNWIVRRIVDLVAEDMVKAWIDITSEVNPKALDRIDRLERVAHVREKITEGLEWARLFGGAAGLMMIDGLTEEDLLEPLDRDRIMPGSFKGVMVLDRWSGVYPDTGLVDDIGDPEFGLPEYYEIADYTREKSYMVHHSHILRFNGCHLPSWEQQSTQMWGASEIEAVYEELVKRDNTSANLAGLIFRANLNIRKIKDLGPTLSMADAGQTSDLYTTLEAQNMLLNNFATYVMDSEDDFTTIQNTTFSGLNDIYESFMADVSGATGIPVTLLFGRSPAGMNATGESDLQNYYDMIGRKQGAYLRPILEKLLPVEFMSEFGEIPDDINFQFNSPRSESETEVADVVQKKATVINDVFNSGLLPQKIALKELQEIGRNTDMFTNITDEDVEAADAMASLGDLPGLDTTAITDAEPFDESKHPRAADGKFGAGGGEQSKNSIDPEEIKRYNDLLLKIKTKTGHRVKRVSKHTIERCSQRKIKPEEIVEALKEPLVLLPAQRNEKGMLSQVYMGRRISAAFNPENGTVTTVWVRKED
jgi:phage-related protein (TIGR01555 family)